MDAKNGLKFAEVTKDALFRITTMLRQEKEMGLKDYQPLLEKIRQNTKSRLDEEEGGGVDVEDTYLTSSAEEVLGKVCHYLDSIKENVEGESDYSALTREVNRKVKEEMESLEDVVHPTDMDEEELDSYRVALCEKIEEWGGPSGFGVDYKVRKYSLEGEEVFLVEDLEETPERAKRSLRIFEEDGEGGYIIATPFVFIERTKNILIDTIRVDIFNKNRKLVYRFDTVGRMEGKLVEDFETYKMEVEEIVDMLRGSVFPKA
jgi:hypothetical protein